MRRWGVVAVAISLGLILVLAAGCSRSAKVPNVVGMPYDQAVKKLQDDGFKLGETKYGFSNNATAGIVARQSPTAGNQIERNGVVVLTVVQPLGSLTTPNVVGLPREQAESALATLSLKPEVGEDYSAQVPAGIVIVQAPLAGVLINPGDTVGLVVSKGPAPARATVPPINGKKQSEAEAALKAVGLVPAPYQAYNDKVAKGLVADQNPVAGASMAPGSKVTFVVSLGPPTPTTVSVPNVVGKSQAEAETALRSAGFVPSAVFNVNPTVAKGLVAGQSPAAGSKSAPGATVGILVSLGADTSVTVPNVVGKTAEEAATAITAAGLVPQVAEQPDAEVPAGTVISQGPTGGVKAEAGSTVLYTVSAGTPQPK